MEAVGDGTGASQPADDARPFVDTLKAAQLSPSLQAVVRRPHRTALHRISA